MQNGTCFYQTVLLDIFQLIIKISLNSLSISRINCSRTSKRKKKNTSTNTIAMSLKKNRARALFLFSATAQFQFKAWCCRECLRWHRTIYIKRFSLCCYVVNFTCLHSLLKIFKSCKYCRKKFIEGTIQGE